MDADTWRLDVEADVTLLQRADIRPRAIALRLNEIAEEKNSHKYPEFSACGRGISFYDTDRGQYVITLEFRNADLGKPAFTALEGLKEQFRAIESCGFWRSTRDRRCAILTLTLKAKPKQ